MRLLSSYYAILLLLFSHTTRATPEIYSFGVVPQFTARAIQQNWQPILAEVSRLSGIRLELVASTRIPEFEKAFVQGKFDFAYMNPYHAVIAKQMQGYQPVLHDHAKRLSGIVVVRKDSKINDIRQLDGKKIAMPAPNALGAALLPRTEFATKLNIKPVISYVRSHDSVYLNTVLGTVDAGGGVIGTLNRQPAEIRNKLRILYKTGNVARHPVSVHPRVPPEVVEKVRSAFLQMGKSEAGRNLLKKIPIHQISNTSFKDYQELIDMGLDRFYIQSN